MFKGFPFFALDSLVATFCEILGVSIGHSKDVVSLNSLVCATVARDWFTDLMALLFVLNAEEDLVSCLE